MKDVMTRQPLPDGTADLPEDGRDVQQGDAWNRPAPRQIHQGETFNLHPFTYFDRWRIGVRARGQDGDLTSLCDQDPRQLFRLSLGTADNRAELGAEH